MYQCIGVYEKKTKKLLFPSTIAWTHTHTHTNAQISDFGMSRGLEEETYYMSKGDSFYEDISKLRTLLNCSKYKLTRIREPKGSWAVAFRAQRGRY